MAKQVVTRTYTASIRNRSRVSDELDALGAVVLFVLNKNPRFRDLLTTFWATTERRFVSVHGKGEGACDSVLPSEYHPRENLSLWRPCGSNASNFWEHRSPVALTHSHENTRSHERPHSTCSATAR